MSITEKLEILLQNLYRHDEAHPGSYFHAKDLLSNQGIEISGEEADQLADELESSGYVSCEKLGMSGARVRITITGKIEAERLNEEAESSEEDA